ncbi:MAG TPA: sulfotransferase [Verrucomicrobiae bacterium]|jgi:tetratricopeptide (TPR) repeat protein|nr:sulfotransferase [Verrucomicrobiae bacterium]
MKRPPLIAAGSLNRMLQSAEAAWERRDFQECLETLQSASRLAPSNAAILLQLGRIHGLRYDYAAAERCFEQALRFASQKTVMLTAIVDHCEKFRSPDLAEHYLRRALESPDATPQYCIKLAEIYERLRRLPEALQLVERALTLAPANPAALLVCARLERLAGRLEAAEQLLRSFVTKLNPDIWVHAQAWYEFGNVLDRQEKYDEAMTAFLEAKALMRPQAPGYLAELKAFRARLKIMQSNVSAEMFRRWFDAAPVLLPARRVALLSGHVRSGTTLLEQVLDSHPDIVSAEETKVFLEETFAPLKRATQPDTYMLPVLESATIPVLQQLRASYFHTMELLIGSSVTGRLLVDKNPGLTHLIPAFVRIFPETKFLIALRDPRDVVLSCFMQAQPLYTVTAAFLSLEGTSEDYADVMSMWRTLAPLLTGRCLEVRYEDMVADLESVARKTLDFLDVPWDARVLGFDEHARKKMVISPTYTDVTQPIYKRAQGRWLNYQKYLEPHLEKLEPFVKEFGYE